MNEQEFVANTGEFINNTGGPAFPSSGTYHAYDGMTLRDWFAGQVAGEVYSTILDVEATQKEGHEIWVFDPVATANRAYAFADAMLLLRDKAKGEQP
jgi:hypothetical protein